VPHPRKREFFLFKWHVLVHFERACLDATAYSSCVFTLHALPTQLPPDDHLNSAIVSASVSGTLSGKSWMDMSPQWRRPCNQSWIFKVVQVIKSLWDSLRRGNKLRVIDDNAREWRREQKCYQTMIEGWLRHASQQLLICYSITTWNPEVVHIVH